MVRRAQRDGKYLGRVRPQQLYNFPRAEARIRNDGIGAPDGVGDAGLQVGQVFGLGHGRIAQEADVMHGDYGMTRPQRWSVATAGAARRERRNDEIGEVIDVRPPGQPVEGRPMQGFPAFLDKPSRAPADGLLVQAGSGERQPASPEIEIEQPKPVRATASAEVFDQCAGIAAHAGPLGDRRLNIKANVQQVSFLS